jgi:hypothetical protein
VTVRRGVAFLLVALVLAAGVACPATAAAEDAARPAVEWKDHPGAAVAAGFGVGALALLALAGYGLAIALLGAVFVGVQAAADRRARALGAGWPFVVGSLLAIGVVFVLAAAASSGSKAVAGLALLLVGLPALLMFLLGATAGVPLLGERLLGARGPGASPLWRCVVGSLALGLGLLPGTLAPVLAPLSVLVLLSAVGWPLGLGLATVLPALRGARPRDDLPGAPRASDAGPGGLPGG